MIATKQQHDIYISLFEQQQSKLAAVSPSWVGPIRKAAIHRFAELGFPTTKNEEWKYTNVSPMTKVPFQPATVSATGRSDVSVLHFLTDPAQDQDCIRLVFVNGSYSGELSATGRLQAGVRLGSLARALADDEATLEAHLARYAGFDDHAFAALNTAFMQDGGLIEIGKDVIVDRPIHLLYASTGDGQPTVTHPRNLILVGRGSQVNIIETYVGLGVPAETPVSNFQFPLPSSGSHGVYFTNSVTEVVVAEGAVVDYCKVQQENSQAFHVASLNFQQDKSSSVTTHTIAFGSGLDREEVTTVLRGEGAESLLHGLYVITGEQHVDNHTVIDHAKPHCSSRELYKGILDGSSSGVFNGKIIVRKDAQKTDSKQSNKNLLLSEEAVINTKPQLEIYADDVKCTHGATIGQIDQEAVFYLRSRGIGLEHARNMLTQAFANDVIEKVKFESRRERLRQMLVTRLAQGHKPGTRGQKLEERMSTLEEA
jgi:Fe-S cluster assembly protein SufD